MIAGQLKVQRHRDFLFNSATYQRFSNLTSIARLAIIGAAQDDRSGKTCGKVTSVNRDRTGSEPTFKICVCGYTVLSHNSRGMRGGALIFSKCQARLQVKLVDVRAKKISIQLSATIIKLLNCV